MYETTVSMLDEERQQIFPGHLSGVLLDEGKCGIFCGCLEMKKFFSLRKVCWNMPLITEAWTQSPNAMALTD
jgi:hypothetical protein